MSEEYTDWQDWEVKLVKNQDGICSIWPVDKQNAPGWEDVGICGTKATCLDYVNDHCDSNCRLRKPGKLEVSTQELVPSEEVSE